MINQGMKLRGRIDQATIEKVHGWAFDEEDVERQIEVSVFLNEHKIAQVRCDATRQDLINAGTFGSVGHGFEYRFDPPLDATKPSRVTVRCLDSGRMLDRGDRMVPDSAPSVGADFGQTLPPAFPSLPVPRSPRDWINLLGLMCKSLDLI